jgi:hypothetical protein
MAGLPPSGGTDYPLAMPTTSEDERLHPVEDPSKHWSDSLYFNAWDRTSRVFLMTRMAVLPNKPGATGGVLAWVGDMPTYAFGHDLDYVPPSDWDVMQMGGLTYRMEKPLQTWVVQLEDGENRANLTWEGYTGVFHYHDNAQPLPRAVAWGHYEQSCTVRGELVLNGRLIRFDGVGQRDHSWGYRHWAGLTEWHWITALFGTQRSFNLFHVFQPDGTVTVNGFVHDKGEDLPILSVERDVHAAFGRTPETCYLELTVAGGRTFSVTGRRAAMAVPVKPGEEGTVVHEVPMAFESDGLEGLGIYEYLENHTAAEA